MSTTSESPFHFSSGRAGQVPNPKDQYRPPLRDIQQQPLSSPVQKGSPEEKESAASFSRSTVTLDIPVQLKKVLRSHALHSVRDLEWRGNLISAADLSKGEFFDHRLRFHFRHVVICFCFSDPDGGRGL
jgi:hypothetical protein